MPSDGEITFADHAGRFFARRFGMAPMVGRLIGYLAVCDPREQTISELAEALLASRSAIAGAVSYVENLGLIRRSRAAGVNPDQLSVISRNHDEESNYAAQIGGTPGAEIDEPESLDFLELRDFDGNVIDPADEDAATEQVFSATRRTTGEVCSAM